MIVWPSTSNWVGVSILLHTINCRLLSLLIFVVFFFFLIFCYQTNSLLSTASHGMKLCVPIVGLTIESNKSVEVGQDLLAIRMLMM